MDDYNEIDLDLSDIGASEEDEKPLTTDNNKRDTLTKNK